MTLQNLTRKQKPQQLEKITELLVNIGIPGGYGFSLGSKLAGKAMQAGKTGTLLKANSPKLASVLDNMKASQSAAKLTAGALTGGVAEGVFVGDVKRCWFISI